MRLKIVLAVCLALSCAVLVVSVGPSATGASSSRVERLRERLHLIDGYLEHYANANYSRYPPIAQVRRGGIPGPAWPANPWTGRPMKPGTAVGDFTYTVVPGRWGCALTARYPGGTITVQSDVPYTRKMQNDHRSGENGELLKFYADLWARRHGGRSPAAGQMAFDAGVGKQSGVAWWPHNSWTHEPMHQGTGWGDFTYGVDAHSGIFSIVVHFSRGGHRTFRGPLGRTLASASAGSTHFSH